MSAFKKRGKALGEFEKGKWLSGCFPSKNVLQGWGRYERELILSLLWLLLINVSQQLYWPQRQIQYVTVNKEREKLSSVNI